ncbi:MAG: asparaginase [bacterium]|jgi:L-asparaginase II
MHPQVLANVYRGSILESSHYGSVVVVNRQGEIVYKIGNPKRLTCLRSAAKPLQVLPLFTSGAAAAYGFSDPELAVMCASHSGQPIHQQQVSAILERVGLSVDSLQCGTHRPFHRPTARALQQEGKKPTPLHNTCSGKHACMLAITRHQHWDISTYTSISHPVQQEMLSMVAKMTGIRREDVQSGLDTCGVPVFAVPLVNIALAFARLVKPEAWEEPICQGMKAISFVMEHYPELLAGEGRFTTALLRACRGKLVAKDGGEALFAMGVPVFELGIAVKIEDGSDRALGPVVLEVLKKVGVLSEPLPVELEKFALPKILTHAGQIAGEVRAVEL